MKIRYLSCKKPRTCKKCQNKFSNRAEIDGRLVKLDSRSYCLDCSPFNAKKANRNRTQLSKYKAINEINHKFCKGCQQWINVSNYYIHKGHLGTLCKTCNSIKSQNNRTILKTIAVKYKGGICIDCNKSFHISVYDFHHLDPTQKDFNMMSNVAAKLDDIKDELDKCVLLCANCHRLRHFDSTNKNYSPTGNVPVRLYTK